MDRNGHEKQKIVTNSSEIYPFIPGPPQYIGDSSMKTDVSHHFSSPKLRISEVETLWSIRLHTVCIHISDLQSAPKDGIQRAAG